MAINSIVLSGMAWVQPVMQGMDFDPNESTTPTQTFYLLQEDGTSKFTLESGAGSLLLEGQ